ncbi:MAG TPA: hypothetical protein VEI54_09865 [Candidatus Limnocylindrales bacterium]|nr:hypothetical protein [Candidatus Limnocylindrales bacterium]
MSTTPRAIATDSGSLLQRVKNVLGAAFFLLVQHSPKLLELYRNEKTWTLFRVALGCFGAALVILPLSLWNGYWTALFGLALFVLSILLPPAELESATDRKARELGAQTVLSGGEYQPPNAPASDVQLFISPSHTWALNKNLDPVVSITTAEISSLRVEPSWGNWVLRVRWADRKAEFVYKGIFAERFARLAEESLRQANLAAQSGAGKTRAARA